MKKKDLRSSCCEAHVLLVYPPDWVCYQCGAITEVYDATQANQQTEIPLHEAQSIERDTTEEGPGTRPTVKEG